VHIIKKRGLAHALSSKVNYEVKNKLCHGNISHFIIKFIGKCEESKQKNKNRALTFPFANLNHVGLKGAIRSVYMYALVVGQAIYMPVHY